MYLTDAGLIPLELDALDVAFPLRRSFGVVRALGRALDRRARVHNKSRGSSRQARCARWSSNGSEPSRRDARHRARLSVDDHRLPIPVLCSLMPALVQEARSSQAAGPGPLGSSSSTGSGSRKRVLILSSSPDSLLSSSETDLCSCSDGDVSSHPDEPPSSSPAPDAAAADLERAGDYTQPSPGASWSSDAEMEALDASSQSLGQLDDVTDEEQQDEGAEDEEDEPTSTQEAQSILRKSVFSLLASSLER